MPAGMNESGSPHLQRRLGVFQATALNMANMVGVGPFITIPTIVAFMPGPQVIVGWAAGLVIALADSMVWCELGAAMPGSGGTYHYLREVFRPWRWGRILPFLFIWQFIFSGPLEVATGCIGIVNYLSEVWPAQWVSLLLPPGDDGKRLLSVAGCVTASLAAAFAVLLLYRRIHSVGKLTVALWTGMVVTVLIVIAMCAVKFSPAQAFAFPPDAFSFDGEFGLALGGALGIAMYDFLGYYDICYVAEEVRDPARTIPVAVVVSVFAVAAIYAGINVGLLGVLPVNDIRSSNAVISDLVRAVSGADWALRAVTWLIILTAFASVFALLLGYSRIPFAAARDGYFFRIFADLHPEGFPRFSLLVLGAVTMVACWFPFDIVLTALLTSRILAQFVCQIAAVIVARHARPDIARPFRMWLYPLPCAVAVVGWLYVFGASGSKAIRFGFWTLALGVAVYFITAIWNARE